MSNTENTAFKYSSCMRSSAALYDLTNVHSQYQCLFLCWDLSEQKNWDIFGIVLIYILWCKFIWKDLY